MAIRDDIYNYESRLSSLKEELNEMTRLYLSDPSSNSKLLTSKINSMKNEIQAINYQLDLLKISLPNIKNNENISEKEVAKPLDAPENSNLNEPLNETHEKDFENTIGKSFMGILASILIFISFIFFAKLLYPILSKAIKILAMYLISGAFTFFGLLKLKKDTKNKLYLSITGCGVGAIFISLILSNVYFKVIGDITLYLLIFAWAIFTAYLARLKSDVFSIIGQVGILISLIFGNILCSNENDVNKFFVLNIFFIITSFIFNTSKTYSKNLVSNIFNIFNLFFMSLYCIEFLNNSNLANDNTSILNITYFTLLIYTAFRLLSSYMFKLDGKNIDFALLNIGYIGILANLIYQLLPDFAFNIVIFIICSLFIVFNEIKFKNNNCIGKTIFQIILMLALVQNCSNVDFIYDYLGISMLAIPFIIYGFYDVNKLFKYAGLATLGIYILRLDNSLCYEIGFVIFALLAFLILLEKEQYLPKVKIITYILFLIFISIFVNNLSINSYYIKDFVAFLFISIFNLIVNTTTFRKNFLTLEIEKSTTIITRITNAFLMIFALALIEDLHRYTAITQLLIILVSLALFLVNTLNLLKEKKNMWVGIYIGIKLTILMLVVLNAWDVTNFTISISCLLFAILGIILGFRLNQKSFRIYGLGLTMLSTIKLLMVDIAYGNSAGRAISFFLSGILCFMISAIYNLLDKKFKQD